MRLIVDECTGPVVARWLESTGHDVVSVFDESPRAPDTSILERAVREDRVIVTNDKDFGEMIFRQRRRHRGVIFLRLIDESPAGKIAALTRFFTEHPDPILGRFV